MLFNLLLELKYKDIFSSVSHDLRNLFKVKLRRKIYRFVNQFMLSLRMVINKFYKRNLRKLAIRHEGHDSATVLRGFAALGVLLTHFNWGGLGEVIERLFSPGLFQIWNSFALLAQMGPTIFFIASGYALTSSIVIRKRTPSLFILQRILRLTPLYALVLLATYSLQNSESFIVYISRIFFIDYFNPNVYLSNPSYVAWTLPLEFWASVILFYALHLKRDFKYLYKFILILLFLSYLTYYVALFVIQNDLYAARFISSAILQIFLGSLIYVIISNLNVVSVRIIFFTLFIVTINLTFEYFRGSFNLPNTILSLWCSTFLIFPHLQYVTLRFPKFFIWQGTICYGIYLIHPLVHMVVIPNTFTQSQFIKLVVSIGVVYTLASISWLIVEMPLIKLGRKIELALKN